MTVEVTPLGVKCNLACTYCYQDTMRAGGGWSPKFSIEKMIEALEKEGQNFIVFGGEALLVPLPVLERLWAYGLRRYGQNGVQTNGTLVTQAHIDAFLRWKVTVGFSMDGPDELNDAREAAGGRLEATRKATARSQAALLDCLDQGVPTSLIITLSKRNGTPERLPRLCEWLDMLVGHGLRDARVHALEVDTPVGKAEALDQPGQLAAFRFIREWSLRNPGVHIDVFADILNLLKGTDDQVGCVWNGCDPLSTPAVRNVDSDGRRTNCARTAKDGVNWLKADTPGQERQLVLYNTPQEHGGCQGCRFFFACKGQCPGEAINGDFRNRSTNCPTWFALLEDAERDLVRAGFQPLSLHPLLPGIERVMIKGWQQRKPIRVAQALRMVAQGYADNEKPLPDVLYENGHGDVAHGDAHGDHTDISRRAK